MKKNKDQKEELCKNSGCLHYFFCSSEFGEDITVCDELLTKQQIRKEVLEEVLKMAKRHTYLNEFRKELKQKLAGCEK